MNCYRDQLLVRNRELQEINTQLKALQSATGIDNKQPNLLSSITHHDIKNQLLGRMGFIEFSKDKCTDPELLHFIEPEETAAHAIERQIEFTKNYEDIGIHAPR